MSDLLASKSSQKLANDSELPNATKPVSIDADALRAPPAPVDFFLLEGKERYRIELDNLGRIHTRSGILLAILGVLINATIKFMDSTRHYLLGVSGSSAILLVGISWCVYKLAQVYSPIEVGEPPSPLELQDYAKLLEESDDFEYQSKVQDAHRESYLKSAHMWINANRARSALHAKIQETTGDLCLLCGLVTIFYIVDRLTTYFGDKPLISLFYFKTKSVSLVDFLALIVPVSVTIGSRRIRRKNEQIRPTQAATKTSSSSTIHDNSQERADDTHVTQAS
jgi:hypothetical protein